MPARKDLTGNTYGKLTVLEFIPDARMWKCVCDCGVICNKHASALTRKRHVNSCGCYQKQILSAYNTNTKKLDDSVTAARKIYGEYKNSANTREYDFTIDFDTFVYIVKQPCTYCGVINSNYRIIRNGSFSYNGLDRVDNSIGYTRGNVVSCCRICNRAKHTLTKKEFQEWINRLVNHQGMING